MRNATCYPINEAKPFSMKRFVAVILFAGMLSIISSTSAQAPAQNDEQALLALIKEVQAQQLEIAANEAKIETKLADVAEIIRVARIYTSRGR
jgi:NADH:ubiquinone oxidoreductase subunit E